MSEIDSCVIYRVPRFCFVALGLVSLLVAGQGFASGGAMHPLPGAPGASVSTPDAANPDANLPTISPDHPERSNVPAGSGPTQASDSKPLDAQTCDPTLEIEFYNNLERYYCLQSSSDGCSSGMSKALKLVANKTPQFLAGFVASMMAGGSVAVVEAWWTKGKSNTSGDVLQAAAARAKTEEFEKLLASLKAQGDENKDYAALIKQAEGEWQARQKSLMADPDFVKSFRNRKKFSVWAAGFTMIGVGAAAANEINMSAMTWGTPAKDDLCKADPSAQWTVQDPDNECRPKYSVTGHVLNFLALPHDKKMEVLKAQPAVCSYYKNFNDHLKNWLAPSKTIRDITCSGAQVSYTVGEGDKRMNIALTTGADGATASMRASRLPAQQQTSTWLNDFSVEFADHGGERVINKVSFEEPTLSPGPNSDARKINLNYEQIFADTTGSQMSESYAPVILSGLTAHKLYSELVKGCCDLKDDALRASCENALENPTEKSMKTQENAAKGTAVTK